jgi:raffinose/stachyose/melibiose transport system substrate-binding protein
MLRSLGRFITGIRTLVLALAAGVLAHVSEASATRQGSPPPSIVIRFAHSGLEPAVVAAFDELAASYMARRPEVQVEQLTVPPRLYRSWIRTQLVGGTAPQLIELTPQVTQDLLSRFFLPLTPWIRSPNPYNAATPLQDVPWQSTFRDNLNTKPN